MKKVFTNEKLGR